MVLAEAVKIVLTSTFPYDVNFSKSFKRLSYHQILNVTSINYNLEE